MRFTLEGQQPYDLPTIDGLTLDETILLEKYAGAGVETFVDGHTPPMGAVKALMVIGLVRAGTMGEQEASALVGSVKLNELDTIIEREEDARPLAPANETDRNGSDGTSGLDGNAASVPAPDGSTLAATGFRRSDTSPISGPSTSAD